MYLQKVQRLRTKIAESGSIGERHGFAVPDSYLNLNVTDPLHCLTARGKTSVTNPDALNPDPDPGFDEQKSPKNYFLYKNLQLHKNTNF
jgi:hypothetical protein